MGRRDATADSTGRCCARPAGTSRIIRALASEWEWRPLDNLPAPPRKHADPRGAIAYREQLAGRPVRTTLEQLARVFEQA
jgi:hypothetical protein